MKQEQWGEVEENEMMDGWRVQCELVFFDVQNNH